MSVGGYKNYKYLTLKKNDPNDLLLTVSVEIIRKT